MILTCQENLERSDGHVIEIQATGWGKVQWRCQKPYVYSWFGPMGHMLYNDDIICKTSFHNKWVDRDNFGTIFCFPQVNASLCSCWLLREIYHFVIWSYHRLCAICSQTVVSSSIVWCNWAYRNLNILLHCLSTHIISLWNKGWAYENVQTMNQSSLCGLLTLIMIRM